MSNVEYGLVMQELERGDSGVRSFVSVQGALVMYPIQAYGSRSRRTGGCRAAEREGGRLLRVDGAGFRIEPGGHARHRAARRRRLDAQRRENLDHQRRHARRGGGVGAGAGRHRRDSWWRPGTPGYSTSDIHGKWSMRASVTSSLAFADCRVPEGDRLPRRRGLKAPLSCLSQARYGIGWGVIGAAMDCYETARAYSVAAQAVRRPARSPPTNWCRRSWPG